MEAARCQETEENEKNEHFIFTRDLNKGVIPRVFCNVFLSKSLAQLCFYTHQKWHV